MNGLGLRTAESGSGPGSPLLPVVGRFVEIALNGALFGCGGRLESDALLDQVADVARESVDGVDDGSLMSCTSCL